MRKVEYHAVDASCKNDVASIRLATNVAAALGRSGLKENRELEFANVVFRNKPRPGRIPSRNDYVRRANGNVVTHESSRNSERAPIEKHSDKLVDVRRSTRYVDKSISFVGNHF